MKIVLMILVFLGFFMGFLGGCAVHREPEPGILVEDLMLSETMLVWEEMLANKD
jgi:hypothetical protein